MSRARQARLSPSSGEVVFGQLHISVRWNQHSLYLSIESTNGGSYAFGPEDNSPAILLALAAAHRQGRLLAFLQSAFAPVLHAPEHRHYLCGKIWCCRPYSQEPDHVP